MPNDHFIVGCEYRALVDHPNALSQFKQNNIFKVTEEGRSPGMILSRYFKYHGDPNSTEWPYTPISFYRYFELVLTTSTIPFVTTNPYLDVLPKVNRIKLSFTITGAQCPRCSEQLTKEKDWSEKNNSLVCWRCGIYV